MTDQVSLSPAKGTMAVLPCPLSQAPWQHPPLQLQQKVLQSKARGLYKNFILNTRCHWHTLNSSLELTAQYLLSPSPKCRGFFGVCASLAGTPQILLRSAMDVFSMSSLPKLCVCLGSSKYKCFQNGGFFCICVFSLVSDKYVCTERRYKLPRIKRMNYPVILPVRKKNQSTGFCPFSEGEWLSSTAIRSHLFTHAVNSKKEIFFGRAINKNSTLVPV